MVRSSLVLVAALAFLSVSCGPITEDDADGGGPTHCVPANPIDCDLDGDTYTPNQGDCNDNDPNIHPGAAECNANQNGDGIDNNCNQFIDEGCLNSDADGDGYTVGQGDCNDADATVNPAAYEVPGNNKDDNCDGRVDEPTECDCTGTFDPQDINSYIKALELCNTPQIQNPAVNGSPKSRGIFQSFGAYAPRVPNSCNFVILSSGVAGSKDPQDDTLASNLGGPAYSPNPAKYPENPGYDDEPTEVFDYTEIRMALLVPTNAKSFSFDFVFLTSEYPEYSCTQFNDTFIAWLKSTQFTGNVSFDGAGNTIQVNSAFFGADPAEFNNTGYDAISSDCAWMGWGEPRANCTMPSVGGSCTTGGTTGWLTTTSPVEPGEMIDLFFAIFDEGDHILDSMVIIDNFRWEVTGSTGPCTDPDGCN